MDLIRRSSSLSAGCRRSALSGEARGGKNGEERQRWRYVHIKSKWVRRGGRERGARAEEEIASGRHRAIEREKPPRSPLMAAWKSVAAFSIGSHSLRRSDSPSIRRDSAGDAPRQARAIEARATAAAAHSSRHRSYRGGCSSYLCGYTYSSYIAVVQLLYSRCMCVHMCVHRCLSSPAGTAEPCSVSPSPARPPARPPIYPPTQHESPPSLSRAVRGADVRQRHAPQHTHGPPHHHPPRPPRHLLAHSARGAGAAPAYLLRLSGSDTAPAPGPARDVEFESGHTCARRG
jgi:hypothetical protein